MIEVDRVFTVTHTMSTSEEDSNLERKISDAIARNKGEDPLNSTELEAVVSILEVEILTDLVSTIISYLSYTDSTINGGKYIENYVLAPIIDRNVPCLVISAPKKKINKFRYCLSSIKLELGWFPNRMHFAQSRWPKGGKFYCCIQLFNSNSAPHDTSNKILWKSSLYTTFGDHEMEHVEMQNIDLIMEYDTSYLFYVIELDHKYTEDKQWIDAYNRNEGYGKYSTPCDWDRSIGFPTKYKDGLEELKQLKIVTDVNYRTMSESQKYEFNYSGSSKVYEVTVYPLCT